MVDLNSDMGEIEDSWYFGKAKELLKHISSVNISCGVHAGTPKLILETVQEAIKQGLNIGAHPSFPDRENFGRRSLNISDSDLEKSLLCQILYLKGLVEENGGHLHHVKPHGALYNLASENRKLSILLCQTIREVDQKLVLFCPFNSELEKAAAQLNLKVWREAFADRRYQEDGTLMPRTQADALIEDPILALEQVQNIINEGLVLSNEGQMIPVKAETICVHGDGKNSLEIAKTLFNHLRN